MIDTHPYYDVAVIGGGLAGLATAIRMSTDGYRVIVFEKETYPFDKVCGEYISFESWDLLLSLGVPLRSWQLPVMDTLQLSSPNGNMLQQKLPLGGFGVSRYLLDHEMVKIARNKGSDVREATRVQEVQFDKNHFVVSTDKETVRAKLCCGTFGKRSSLDLKWKRSFVQQKPNALNNYVGVKYHVTIDHPENIIALHNFQDGYCGIAAIENKKVNVCYLTTAKNLRANGNSINLMEQHVLCTNPFLKKIFEGIKGSPEKPVTIAQISFNKKEQVYDHILLMGDSAGLIAPLCGNGMSIALHSSRIGVRCMQQFLHNTTTRAEMEREYTEQWQRTFSGRLRAGRIIQGVFGKKWLTNAAVAALKPFSAMTRSIIRQTHG